MAQQNPPQTVASPILQGLNPLNYIELNVPKINIVYISVKVFYASYLGLNVLNTNSYERHRKEFEQLLNDVFDLKDLPPLNDFYKKIASDIGKETLTISITILKAKGIQQFTNSTVVINAQLVNDSVQRVFALTGVQELQSHLQPIVIKLPFSDWYQMRTSNRYINLQFNCDSMNHRLPYNEIHSEGFLDWIQFANNASVLMRVRFSTSDAYSPFAESCHLHLILYFMRYRLLRFRARPTVKKWHTLGTTRKTETVLKRVNVNDVTLFWVKPPQLQSQESDPNTNLTDQEFRNFLRSEGTLRLKLRFHDLHVYNNVNEEIPEDSFCVCNEWCNLSAFFYHNPIIRCILLQHNQLYVANSSVVTNQYLFIISYLLSTQNVAASELTPLYDILRSSKMYCERNLAKGRTDPAYWLLYSIPLNRDLLGVSYNCLRYGAAPTLSIGTLIIENQIFTNSSLENIKTFYDVITFLHNFMACNLDFVPLAVRSKWFAELESPYRIWYHNFLITALHATTNIHNVLLTRYFLFRLDFHSEPLLERVGGIEQVIEFRNKLFKFGGNPFDIEFVCKTWVSFMINLSKFIEEVVPSLGSLNKPPIITTEATFYQELDNALNLLLSGPKFNFDGFNAMITSGTQLSFNDFYYYEYFTLALYGISYSIKSFIMKTHFKFNRIHKIDKYASESLHFIRRTDWIEYSYRENIRVKQSKNLALIANYDNFVFPSDDHRIDQAFNLFYVKYWKASQHDHNINLNAMDLLASVRHQYARLYRWNQLNGNNRPIFINIINFVRLVLESQFSKSKTIYLDHIIGVFAQQKEFENIVELIDVLVFWLVRAQCSVAINSAITFLRNIHNLQDAQVVLNATHFTLAKPGFVHLFRTLNIFFEHIHRIKCEYILYDDELNQISNILEETQSIVKKLYRYVYKKLGENCFLEIRELLFNITPCDQHSEELLKNVVGLHLINFVNFIGNFNEVFRYEFQSIRRRTFAAVAHMVAHGMQLYVHQNLFINSLPTAIQWLGNKQELQMSAPFAAQTFINVLPVLFQEFQNMNLVDLDINICAANTGII